MEISGIVSPSRYMYHIIELKDCIKESVELENDDLPAGWLTNRVVRIVRYSRSAGSSTAFRLIVESA